MITKRNNDEENYYYTDYFILKAFKKAFKIYLCFCKINNFQHKKLIASCLHYEEKNYYETLEFERRRKSFLLGRFVAKKAVSELVGEEDLKKILIKNGIFNQPIVIANKNVQVSITHCEDLGAAVAFSDMFLIGIDIEKVDVSKRETLESQLTLSEKEIADNFSYPYDYFLTMIWTIKESLSKVLKTGLTIPFSILEVKSMEVNNEYITSSFSNFPQYSTISFMVVKDYICSITYPKNVEIDIDISKIKENLSLYSMISKNTRFQEIKKFI